MPALFKNNVTASLAASISDTVTTIVVASGQGSLFPTITSGQYFFATLYDASNNIEIVKVTARTTDTLTVVRGFDNSVARSYLAGDKIAMRLTAAALENFIQVGQTATTATTATTAITAGAIANTGGWNVTPSGTKLYLNYNGTNVGSLDSTGNLIVIGNITAYGTP